jgi:PAS domain S-box-containing protein
VRANKHRRLELQLARAEERFRTLVEQIPAIVYTFEVGGRWRYVSPYIQTMYGYAPAEWMEQPELWLERVHPEDRERVTAQDDHSRTTGEPFRIEYRVRSRDDRIVWVREDAVIIPDEGGKPSLFQGVIFDITARREAESALEGLNVELERRVAERTEELEAANHGLVLAKEAAEQANLAKSGFLSRASHELRTPMNAILGFGQLLESSTLSPNDRDSVGQIVKAGHRLLGLINDLLDLSRVEANRLSLSIEPVSVPEVVRESLDLVRPLATRRGVDIRVEQLDPPGHVLADRERLKQVLLNLLSNAIKFNRDHGGTVAVSGGASGDRGVIRVSDTGPGIPQEALEQLYVPFDRIGAGSTPIGGKGLGLTMAKALTEAMGGRIDVDSQQGRGSTFVLSFPLPAKVPVVSEDAAEPEGPRKAPTGLHTILYIEDNMPNLVLVKRILAYRPGIDLVSAMQGGLGVELARERPPNLVLLDLHLPDMSGEEALRQLRADPRTSEIPIIVMSAQATPGSIQRILANGANAYLTKPLDVHEVLEVVDSFLDRRDETPGQPNPTEAVG